MGNVRLALKIVFMITNKSYVCATKTLPFRMAYVRFNAKKLSFKSMERVLAAHLTEYTLKSQKSVNVK
jgi:hypothetical protein